MKTLYISDLDGTLLNKEANVSDYSIDVMNQLIQKGIYFTCATARTVASTCKILEPIAINVPMVLMNGVCVYDSIEEKYKKIEYLNPSQTSTIIAELKNAGVTGFMYEIKDHILTTYYENLDAKARKDFHDERVNLYQKNFTNVNDFSNIDLSNIIYFCILDYKEKLECLVEVLLNIPDVKVEFYKDIYSEDFWYLEIFRSTATKYNAVNYLRKEYHFDKVIGFGDNLNDLPFFKACDECYAVLNAKDEVKKAATAIIDSNTNNAVANWLKSHVFL